MVPNISRNGRSFRGAGAYHLHDKPNAASARPRTSERVAFTAARNLANSDPRAALDEMWRTAKDAAHLKARSGLAPTGRKNDAPVKTVSLAWAPGEVPTKEAMCRAADGFLKAMGWSEHQALYVAHNDTRHPHLHVIVNRVHPESGRTLGDWQERKRAQTWAHAYEKARGAVLCPARAEPNDPRDRAPTTRLPYRHAKLFNSDDVARGRLARKVRAAFRPAWAAHYRRQRAALARFDRERRGIERRAAFLARTGDAAGAQAALDVIDRRRDQLLRTFRHQRIAVARAQHRALRTLVAAGGQASITAPAPIAVANAKREVCDSANGAVNQGNRAPTRQHMPRALSRPWVRLRLLRPGAGPAPRAERLLLLAMQAAARALLTPQRSVSRDVAARARADVELQFAHRWAALRRMRPQERAAAAAALKVEQAAALATRTAYLLGELHLQHQAQRTRLRTHLAAQRGALSARPREAWAKAAAVIRARRPVLARATGPPRTRAP
jgi:hypothetical protein